MFTTRFNKFATASITAAGIGLAALATAGSASAETYQGGVVGGPNGGHGTAHWQGTHPGSANVHSH